MKTFEQDFKTNPSFNTVTGLTNTTFDPNNVVSGRGATEDQVKFVHDMIKELQDWLDENGCSDDPYAIIRQKIDEVEDAIDVCCANPQDTLIQMLTNRLNQLETDMNTCCQAMDDNAYQTLVDRLDALQQSSEQCCLEYEEKVQRIIDNIIHVPTEGGCTNQTVPASSGCQEGAVEVTYEFDISQFTQTEVDRQTLAGKVIPVFNVTGKYATAYFFAFQRADGSFYNYRGYYARIEGHTNITFQLNMAAGLIFIRNYQPGFDGGLYYDSRDDSFASGGIVGPNSDFKKLFLEVRDNNNCYWRTELPLSVFDFTNIDASNNP